METTELMIGDWVKHLNNPRRIKGAVDLTFAKDFEPIPLTAEILEKNGFVKHDKIHPYYMDYYHEKDGFTIFNSSTWHGHILDSVHEIQHALRLCGLKGLADNFKV